MKLPNLFKKKFKLVCISCCEVCGSPIFGPPSIKFDESINTAQMCDILCNRIVWFCGCRLVVNRTRVEEALNAVLMSDTDDDLRGGN